MSSPDQNSSTGDQISTLSYIDTLDSHGIQNTFPIAAQNAILKLPLDPNTKHARKVYIGNLPPAAGVSQIQTFMNDILNTKLPNKPPGEVVVSVYLNDARRFAFIELRSIEEASYTLTLDGLSWSGCSLKFRRPQDFSQPLFEQQYRQEMLIKQGRSSLAGASGAGINTCTGTPNVISSCVEDGPNKVFVGGLPHILTEEDCKQLLQAFGALKSFHLVRDKEKGNECKGYAFCEFVEEKATVAACQGLNGMKIADRCLNVRRAVTPEAGSEEVLTGDYVCDVLAGEQYNPKGKIYLEPGNYDYLTATLKSARRLIAIHNMITADKANTPQYITRWIGDAKNECSKVCPVLNVEIYKLDVLVECQSAHDAVRAMRSLQGKMYDGRLLSVSFCEGTPTMKRVSVMRMLTELNIPVSEKMKKNVTISRGRKA